LTFAGSIDTLFFHLAIYIYQFEFYKLLQLSVIGRMLSIVERGAPRATRLGMERGGAAFPAASIRFCKCGRSTRNSSKGNHRDWLESTAAADVQTAAPNDW
jgi:hypothetical protein